MAVALNGVPAEQEVGLADQAGRHADAVPVNRAHVVHRQINLGGKSFFMEEDFFKISILKLYSEQSIY